MTAAARRKTFRRFIESEAAGGLVLMGAAALGLLAANSPLADSYTALLHANVAGLDVLHWIEDGLMAMFFLLVGLEIKREVLEGQLATWTARALPVIAAFGGMAVPALVFLAANAGHRDNWHGWAIPTATDIAFALGVLALVGSRVAHSLKVFLTSLAIIDDLGAILIIAIFYAQGVSAPALALAAVCVGILSALNRFGVARLWPYLVVGAALWVCMLFSGVHATLAGVLLAMTIPLTIDGDSARSPLHDLEHGIAPWVAFLVLPIFGFANAGVTLDTGAIGAVASPLSLGVAGGLFFGKQAGIMASVLLATRLRLARLPVAASWREIYGVSVLCGIGFTMSLFIGYLAFDDPERLAVTKLAILIGSLLSALLGAAILLTRKTRES